MNGRRAASARTAACSAAGRSSPRRSWNSRPPSNSLETAMKPLHGRIAVVAGASRGIGMGVAIELGAAGAFVYALGRTLMAGSGGAPGTRAAGSLEETVAAIAELGGEGQA